MKRIIERAKLSQPAPIVIKLDPNELKGGIVMPKIKYEIVATFEQQEVFYGMVLPIPKILIFFLNRNELMLVATIMEEMSNTGECALSVKELAKKINVAIPTVSTSLYNLRKLGLLLESPNGQRGAGRTRKINYTTLQHLNDLAEGEDLGVYARIRKASRKSNIMSLTKNDIKQAYDHQIADPDDGEAEAEEYD